MSGKLTRDAYRKKMELEAARKAGLAPAELDVDGSEINPHIPDYIKQAPWYADAFNGAPTLHHQRNKRNIPDEKDEFSLVTKPPPVKFRKGACANCGAMTHKERDCLERPRKLGAKWTGKDLRADEHVHYPNDLDYDTKRDRWKGYDPSQHLHLAEEYALVENARREKLALDLRNKPESESKKSEIKDSDDDDDDDDDDDNVSANEDDDKYAESADMPGQKVDTKSRITVRNLRIREDTAKYLHNLDPNSAYYDPKTRSMRENPFPEKNPNEIDYAGDNFTRSTKEDQKLAQMQLFAWEASEKGAQDLHLQATPSQAEFLFKQHQKKKTELKQLTQSALMEAYGGAEHMRKPRISAQSEEYKEYDAKGKLMNQPEPKICSIYEEDVYPGNHTSIWGSYWFDGKWGYACCKQSLRNAYCLKSQ